MASRIRLELSQRTLGALVAASRENVNRALAPLVAAGVISQRDGRFVIHDHAGLAACGRAPVTRSTDEDADAGHARPHDADQLSSIGHDLAALRAGFAGEILTAADGAAYDDARVAYNAMFDRRPAVIARATSRTDVACAIGYARARRIDASPCAAAATPSPATPRSRAACSWTSAR